MGLPSRMTLQVQLVLGAMLADPGAERYGLQPVGARTRRDAETGLISRAYATAARVHAGQARKSGAPYITHPVAVAAILAEASADDQTICAALLHDTLDGTGYSLAALSAEFGAAVADLVTVSAALDDTCP